MELEFKDLQQIYHFLAKDDTFNRMILSKREDHDNKIIASSLRVHPNQPDGGTRIDVAVDFTNKPGLPAEDFKVILRLDKNGNLEVKWVRSYTEISV